MNHTEPKYTGEYVELKTSLEHIRTRLENIDSHVRMIQQTMSEYHRLLDKNRSDIAGIKAIAAVIGGLAGSVVAFFLRFFVTKA